MSQISVNQAIELKNAGKFQEAAAMYEKLIEATPEDSKAWYNRGVLYTAMQNTDEAIYSYEQAVDIDPDYYKAWTNLGNLFMKESNFEDALTCFETAHQLVPQDYIPLFNLGIALRNLQAYEDSLSCFDDALALIDQNNVKDLTGILFEKGISLIALQKANEVIKIYTQVIDLAPESDLAYQAYYYIGTMLDNTGKSQEALPYVEKSLALNANFTPALQTMGCILIHLKRNKEATPYLDKVLAATPKNWEAYYNIASNYAGIEGEESKAQEYLEKALAMVPPAIDLKSHLKVDPDWEKQRNKDWFLALVKK